MSNHIVDTNKKVLTPAEVAEIREHIKSLVDSIKLGVVDVSEAFAGNLLIYDKAGRGVKLADQIKSSVASGKLDLPGFGVAMLEDKRS